MTSASPLERMPTPSRNVEPGASTADQRIEERSAAISPTRRCLPLAKTATEVPSSRATSEPSTMSGVYFEPGVCALGGVHPSRLAH